MHRIGVFRINTPIHRSGFETEYVWGTCMELNPAHLSDSSTLAQYQSIKVVKTQYISVNSSDFSVPMFPIFSQSLFQSFRPIFTNLLPIATPTLGQSFLLGKNRGFEDGQFVRPDYFTQWMIVFRIQHIHVQSSTQLCNGMYIFDTQGLIRW